MNDTRTVRLARVPCVRNETTAFYLLHNSCVSWRNSLSTKHFFIVLIMSTVHLIVVSSSTFYKYVIRNHRSIGLLLLVVCMHSNNTIPDNGNGNKYYSISYVLRHSSLVQSLRPCCIALLAGRNINFNFTTTKCNLLYIICFF